MTPPAISLKPEDTLPCCLTNLVVCLLLILSPAPTWALDAQSLTIAMRGDKSKLEALVANSPEVKGEIGARAIYLQSLFGNYEGIRILIAHGANINYREPLNGYTPLHDAVTYAGRWPTDPRGEMLPMDITVAENKFKTAELLIAHGADVNVKSKYGATPLHKAGTKELAELLIRSGANVNDKTPGNTPLYFAAGGKYLEEVVEVLVAHGADVNSKNSSGVTPLHQAVSNNQKQTVEFLIKHGADAGAKDQNGTTPWDIAVRENKNDLTPILLSTGTKFNSTPKDGVSDLHKAAAQGNRQLIEQLLSHGAQISAVDRNGDTALFWAISYFHNDIAKLLIEHGADVNARSKDGTPLLHRTHNIKTLELLIAHGADMNAKDGFGNTLLHIAIQKGFTSTVKLLLARKVTVNIRNNKGQTPLSNAIIRQGWLVDPESRSVLQREYGIGLPERAGEINDMTMHPAKTSIVRESERRYGRENIVPSFEPSAEIVKLLLSYGADVMEKDWHGETLLHIAPTAEIADLLMAQGVPVDAQRNDGATPLHLAAAYGKPAIVKTLLAHGASVSASTNNGVTPLHYAPNVEVAGLLLARGADANAKTKGGLTPLQYAKGKEIGELLLTGGADVDSTDNDGNTPLFMAGEQAVVMLLLEHGAKINARNNTGQTPLLRMVRLLRPIARLPRINIISLDEPINRSLEYGPSRERGGSIETIRALLDQGADVNLDDREGFMPLHYVRKLMKDPAFANLITPLKEIEGMLIAHGAKLERRKELQQDFPPELAGIPQLSLGTRVLMQIDIQYEERKRAGRENPLYYRELEMMQSTSDKFAFDDNQQLLDYFQTLSAEVRKNGLWVKRMARHLWTPPDEKRIDKLAQSAISQQIPLFLCAPSAPTNGSRLITWECDQVNPHNPIEAVICLAVEAKGQAARWECRWKGN